MAAEVVLSPKRSIMDLFKTPTKVSRESSNKKSQGILSFFTSTPRTPRLGSVSSDPSLKKQSCSSDEEVQVLDSVSGEKGKESACRAPKQDLTAVDSGNECKSTKIQNSTNITAIPDKEHATIVSLKQKGKLKTKKPLRKKCAYQTDNEPAGQGDATHKEKKENSEEENTNGQPSEAFHGQMDYEEFKMVLLQQSQQQTSDTVTVNVSVTKEKENELEQREVSVVDHENDKQEKIPEAKQDEASPSKDSFNADFETPIRQLRTRTRKSTIPTSIATNASPVLSPVSSKKDDSDLSLHGKDILEMTYEEYLKSIGAFDKSDTSNNESVNNSQQLEAKSSSTCATNSSTPSLYNFFSKTAKSTKQTEEQAGSTTVTFAAVIHGEPSVNRAMAIKERAKNALRLSKVATQDKSTSDQDEIEVLGSETVCIDVDADEKASVGSKTGGTIDLKEPGIAPESVHPVFKQLTVKQTQPSSEVVSIEDTSICKAASVPEKHVKKTQATLSFKKGGGIEINTPITKALELTSETDAGSAVGDSRPKDVPSPTPRDPSRRPKRRRIINEDSDSSCAEGRPKNTPIKEMSGKTSGQKTRLRPARRSLESDSGNDTKDFTPRSKRASTAAQARAQELLMKARLQADLNRKERKQNKKRTSSVGPVKKQLKSDEKRKSTLVANKEEFAGKETAAPLERSRRQSSRLAQQTVQEEKTYIDLGTDSESSDVEVCSPVKKSTKCKRIDSAPVSPEKNSARKSPRKAAGKLAPIFTKLKGGDQEEKVSTRPQEDPEIVRKRREFLMSGVPSELKRQAEASAQAVVLSEFVPFPEFSHVQQQGAAEGNMNMWALSPLDGKLRLLHKDVFAEEISTTDTGWNNLQWTPTLQQKEETLSKGAPHNADVFTLEQKEFLLKELQHHDPAFDFPAMYDKFRVRLEGTVQGKTTQETKSLRKSTRHSSGDSDVLVVDDEEAPGSFEKVSGCQWTEILQPAQASEIVGNAGTIRRLRKWLEDWKLLIQKEARHTARMAANSSDFEMSDSDMEEEPFQLCNTVLLVGPHGVGKTSAVYALAQQLSYKVFEVNASSSRQGRHILAQLQEATQSHQVAQKKDGVIPSTPGDLGTSQCTDLLGKKELKKASTSAVPGAFANFFKKAGGGSECAKKSTAKESVKKESSRKRKRLADPEPESSSQSPKKLRGKGKGRETKPVSAKQEAADGGSSSSSSNMAGCLNLTSTSLILFDEVDLVFDEDTGFLQTVQHFINTTKIPIVMTATDPGFGRMISAKFEQLIFKAPCLRTVASQLQTAFLAAGMRTSRDDVQALATMCKGDVRQALLTLQFLALSGGGASTELRPLSLKPVAECSEKNGQEPEAPLKSDVHAPIMNEGDSEDEFISLRTVRKQGRRIIDDDNEDDVVLLRVDGTTGGSKEAGGETVGASALPPVHLNLHKSVLGVSHDVQTLLAKCLQANDTTPVLMPLVNSCLKLNRVNQLPDTLWLLPLPKVKMSTRWRPPVVPTTKLPRKRIRIADIYDSEASDEEGMDEESVNPTSSQSIIETALTKEEVKTERVNVSETEGACADEKKDSADVKPHDTLEPVCKEIVKTESETKGFKQTSCDSDVPVRAVEEHSCTEQKPVEEQKQAKGSEDGGLTSRILSNFACFYETMSVMDNFLTFENSPRKPAGDCSSLLPGIKDTLPSKQEDRGVSSRMAEEMGAEIGVRAARSLWQHVHRDTSTWRRSRGKELLPDGCCIPLSSESQSTNLDLQADVESGSVPERYQMLVDTVISNLPLMCYNSRQPVSVDYLPTLRAISQAEHNRRVAKTKRRFHHYFDSIGFCLNKPAMSALGDEFPSSQNPSSN